MQSTHLLLEEPIRMASILESSKPNFFPAMTKIVGTLGPKSRSVQVISDCLRAGMSVARFDFSQGDPQYHQQTLANLKVAVKATKKLCAVMLDTIGPELQVVNKNETPVTLEADAFVVLTPHTDQEATSTLLPINFDGLAKAVKQGDTIFVGQYLFTGSESTSVWLEVSEVKGNDLGIFLVTLSFLLLLAILVILTGHGSVLRSLIQNEISSSSSSNETAPFPWTETMLSFQRTAYHYQPERNWMSDPNGPMFYNGWYHLYNLVLSSEIPMSGADSSKMWIRN